jgi:NAD(P)-dependent dehydrogenase (short-subunit alcohol dehydrogenase family)
LAGQVAVITGAGRGIGRAIAVMLAELGAHAVLCGRSRQALEQTAAIIENAGGPISEKGSAKSSKKSSVVECDVTDLDSVEALAQQVESAFHRLDILVNNAGIWEQERQDLSINWLPRIGTAS